MCLKAAHYETAAAGSPESTSSLIPAGKNHTVGVFLLKSVFFPLTLVCHLFLLTNVSSFVHYGMYAVEENRACCVPNVGPESSIEGSLISYMHSFTLIEFQMKQNVKTDVKTTAWCWAAQYYFGLWTVPSVQK